MVSDLIEVDTIKKNHPTVTEVWPGQFDFEIATGQNEILTTVIYIFDTLQLQPLRE